MSYVCIPVLTVQLWVVGFFKTNGRVSFPDFYKLPSKTFAYFCDCLCYQGSEEIIKPRKNRHKVPEEVKYLLSIIDKKNAGEKEFSM